MTSATRTLENGWYAVQGEVTIPEGVNLTVVGTAHLVLCDGAKLAIPNPGEDNAGVKVPENASLVIYGQTSGTGELTANGGKDGAGVGGGYQCSGGTVTINGGNHAGSAAWHERRTDCGGEAASLSVCGQADVQR